MILIDSSAWIEFLRGTPGSVSDELERLLDADIAVCDAISMEILAGARNEEHLAELRGLLARAVTVPTRASDYDDAASLYRTCRRSGRTVRKTIDCLIGAIAIRSGVAVLHHDADFDSLALCTSLTIHAPTIVDPPLREP